MNNHEREERRKLHERREQQRISWAGDINRAHRDCERECIDLKARVGALESLLSESCEKLIELNDYIDISVGHSFDSADEIVKRIDAILPAPELDK